MNGANPSKNSAFSAGSCHTNMLTALMFSGDVALLHEDVRHGCDSHLLSPVCASQLASGACVCFGIKAGAGANVFQEICLVAIDGPLVAFSIRTLARGPFIGA